MNVQLKASIRERLSHRACKSGNLYGIGLPGSIAEIRCSHPHIISPSAEFSRSRCRVLFSLKRTTRRCCNIKDNLHIAQIFNYLSESLKALVVRLIYVCHIMAFAQGNNRVNFTESSLMNALRPPKARNKRKEIQARMTSSDSTCNRSRIFYLRNRSGTHKTGNL